MNIAFDAAAMLANMSKDREDGAWAYEVMEELISGADRENRFFCLNLYNKPLEGVWEDRYSNFKEISFYSGEHIEILRLPEYKSVLEKIITDFIRQYEIDVFVITSAFDLVLTVYEEKWFQDTAVAVLVHDIEPFIKKDLYFTSYSIQKRYYEQLQVLKWADQCVAGSLDVKRDLAEMLGVAPGKIAVYKETAQEEMVWTDRRGKRADVSNRSLRKIAFFAPLPPIESGIAYYSYHILLEISKYLDVDVFIDNEYEADCEFPPNIRVYRQTASVLRQGKDNVRAYARKGQILTP